MCTALRFSAGEGMGVMYFVAKSTQKVGNLPKTSYLIVHNHGKSPIKANILAFGKPIITYILL